MNNPIETRKRIVQQRIDKAFESGLNVSELSVQEIEKARHGVYADNAENRIKQRVGQEYGQAAQPQKPGEKRQPKGSEEGGGDIKSYASNASDEALKRAAADKNAKPEVREAAKDELANRNGSNDKESEPAKKEEMKAHQGYVTAKEFSKNKNAVVEMLKNCDSKTDSHGDKKYHCEFYALGKDRGSTWLKKSDIEAYLRNYDDAKITPIKSD